MHGACFVCVLALLQACSDGKGESNTQDPGGGINQPGGDDSVPQGAQVGDGDGNGDGDGDGAGPSTAGAARDAGEGSQGNATTGTDNAGGSGGSTPDNGSAAPFRCAQRVLEGPAVVHFHHIHFNTTDPDADLSFFERFRNAPVVDFCEDENSDGVTRATRTERGYFLYTKVDEAPDPTLNTYLEHVGWIHPSPGEELARLVALDVPLYPEGRNQCPEAAAGTAACPVSVLLDYYFYLQAPSGARIEIALGPGPADSGFGHVHLIQGVDKTFFATVSDGAYSDVDSAIDLVNHTDVSLTEDMLGGQTTVDTRGKPIDHIAYSTTDLEATKARIEGAGIAIEDDIAFRPEYGFRSFFVRSPKGIWVELVEDSPFQP